MLLFKNTSPIGAWTMPKTQFDRFQILNQHPLSSWGIWGIYWSGVSSGAFRNPKITQRKSLIHCPRPNAARKCTDAISFPSWILFVTLSQIWGGISLRLGNWLESHNLNSLKAPYRSEMLNRSEKRWIDAISKTFHWQLIQIGQFQDRARHRLINGRKPVKPP